MSDSRAIVSRIPGIIAIRREHAAGMNRPMLGAPMVGDPRFQDEGAQALMIRRCCQYSAAMATKAGLVDADLTDVDAYFVPPATVIFVRSDAGQKEIARFTVPDRVMNYDPGEPVEEIAEEESRERTK